MENFTFWNPTKLIFGKGQLEQLKTEITSLWEKGVACLWWRKY